LRRGRPDAVCFDFDYPDRASLQLAAAVKLAWPSLPMIMLTVQHSEALAIWAFRSRFLDYLVKPASQADIDRCIALLHEIAGDKRLQNTRRMPALPVPMPEEAPAPTACDSSLLPAVSFVENNFHDKIQSDDVARLCAMSPFRFSRTFKETFGMPFREYVVRVRLKEACRLLENPQASITEVAYAVGFNDISYFSRMFKRYVGVSPSALQAQPAESRPALHTEVPAILELARPLN
jgi:AraC-like DNA-binding protein